jgi:rod shape-determining protein MreB
MDEEMKMDVRGRDVVAGLPRTITFTSTEATEAMAEPLQSIVNTVKSVLEKTPPELSSDVIDRGIVMTGGTSLLRNLDNLLTRESGIPCHLAEDPLTCVAIGAGLALEHYSILRRNLPPV